MENYYFTVFFYETKIVGILSLLLLLFLLFKMCFRENTSKTIIYHIKIELIISCIIYTIGFLLPTKKSQNDQVQQILCTIQTFLLSFSSNTSIAFTITIPTITYKLLVNPSFIEKHLTIVHLIIAGVCWGFGMIITIIYISITSTDFFEYVGIQVMQFFVL